MAGKTPHGARPNREAMSRRSRAVAERRRRRRRTRTARPKLPGRSLDPASNGGTRGMIVVAEARAQARAEADRIRLIGRLRRFCGTCIDAHSSPTHELNACLHTSSPVARASSDPTSPKSCVRRGDRVRVVDSLITGKRQNLAHLSGVEFLEGDLADLAVAPHGGRRHDYVLHQAAIPSVPRSVRRSRHLEPRQHRRHPQRAGRSTRRRREARGLRRIVVCLRQHADAAQARRHADQPAVALCAAEARRRAIHADVYRALRPRDRDHPLFQRVRAATGSLVALLRRHFGLHHARCSRTDRRRFTATESRPATSPTSPTSSTACCVRARPTVHPDR